MKTSIISESDSLILTPDQRLRVFVSSTLQELSEERKAARDAIQSIQMIPVLFELGARSHAPRDLYRQYLAQSQIFIGIYWNRYGWVAPGETVSGLEDEYDLSDNMPKLIYIKNSEVNREVKLDQLIHKIQSDDQVSYKYFNTPDELKQLIAGDLAILLTERFRQSTQEELPFTKENTFHSIPVKANAMIGREDNMSELLGMLSDSEYRLVTLTGPGGIGKTRLAMELAQNLLHQFSNGVAYIPLAPVRDQALVAETIAYHLGMKLSGANAIESLKLFLENKNILLVLDNFEQVIQAAPMMDDLLAASPGLKILVTSRERLSLSSEQVYVVPPLMSQLKNSEKHTDEEIPSAVKLFIHRAKAVQPSFELNENNKEVLYKLCKRLEGLPLAIELAAGQINIFSPSLLLQKLELSLDVLKAQYRDIPERQKTMRNTIAWSYELLSKAQQELLLQISVFPSGMLLNSIENIPLSQGEEVYSLLSSLMDKSLLQKEEEGLMPRFQMLESVREFALAQMKEEGLWDHFHQVQAEYYLQSLPMIRLHQNEVDQVELLRCLEKEHPNIRQTLDYLMLHEELQKVTEIASNLWLFWWVNAHTKEGYTWLKKAWDLYKQGKKPLDEYTFALLAAHTGIMSFMQRDLQTFQESLGANFELILRQDNSELVATACLITGVVKTILKDYTTANQLLTTSLNLFKKIKHHTGTSLVLSGLGRNAIYGGGQTGLARKYYKESMEMAKLDNNDISYIITLSGFALSEAVDKDPSAKEYLIESLKLSADIHFFEAIAWSLEIWSIVSINENKLERAITLMSAAEHLRNITSLPVWDDLHELIQHSKMEIVQQMDQKVYEECWAYGSSMNLETMVNFALSDLVQQEQKAA
ncbi:MAG: DUF4062 domain-containing protein [Saprospiraceae bacterium]|nr:DUF4062 domain-containing protein [Saprospiraceae bacterium]MBK7811012.1 DUF4062 domain-containing protein [Saprospiraceae bacterium]MBK9630615.1 DUF4062 domain-containing protein [Saprospiraceae bacterium]